MEGWVGSVEVRGMNPKREHASLIQEQVAMHAGLAQRERRWIMRGWNVAEIQRHEIANFHFNRDQLHL